MDDEIRKGEAQPEEERLTEDSAEEIVAEATDIAQASLEGSVNASAPAAADAMVEDAGAESASSQSEPAAAAAGSAPSDRAAGEPRRDFASLSAAAGDDDFFSSYEEEPAPEEPAWHQERMAGSFSSIYSDTEGGGTYNPIPDEPVKKARPGLAKKILAAALTICLCFGAGFGGSVLGNRTSGTQNSVGSAAGLANATSVSISGDLDSLDAASAIAQKLMPSVVGISTVSQTLTETIYGLQSGQSMGIGTGFIVSEDGYILTNSHVVNDGDAETITVDLYDGTEYEGSILWNDPSLDLAVVKIDASGLTPAELGDSDTVQIGNYALAIGNPLGLDFERSVTSGIISGLNRSITVATSASSTTGNTMEGLIQTDASINSGNSGGPLINSAGQVIGINSAKASSAEGLGFSIPINVAIPIIQKIMETGTYDAAYIGITGYDLAAVISSYGNDAPFSSSTGVYVNEVYEGSGAAAAGIQSGDVILGINDEQIVGMSSLKTQLVRYNPGDTINILLERNQEQISVEVTLGSASEASSVVVGSQEEQEPGEEAPAEGEEPQSPEEQPGEEDNGIGSYGGLDDLFDNFFGNR